MKSIILSGAVATALLSQAAVAKSLSRAHKQFTVRALDDECMTGYEECGLFYCMPEG
jgi:hypothetical protein